MHGFGHYFETCEQIGGQWKIKTLQIKRLMLDIKLRQEWLCFLQGRTMLSMEGF